MNKYRLYIMMVIAGLFLTACAGGNPTLSFDGDRKYKIKYVDDDKLFLPLSGNFSLKEVLNIVSKDLRDKNVTAFVVTSPGVNNLHGFPINTYKDLKKFSLLNKDKIFTTSGGNMGIGKHTLRNRFGDFRLLFRAADNLKGSFISTWNVDRTIKDTAI